MSTMTEEPRDDAPVALTVRQDAELVSMPRCTRCQLKYLPARSTSARVLAWQAAATCSSPRGPSSDRYSVAAVTIKP